MSLFNLPFVKHFAWAAATSWLLLPVALQAQNLLPNPSFEQEVETRAAAWMHLPSEFHHYEKSALRAFDGEAMQGICISNSNDNELLTVPLNQPLEEGKRYTLRFAATLFTGTRNDCFNLFHMAEIQAVLGDAPWIPHDPEFRGSNDTTLVRFRVVEDAEQRQQWQVYEASFVARGFERFLTLGYFQDVDLLRWKKQQDSIAAANPPRRKPSAKKQAKQLAEYMALRNEFMRSTRFRARYYFDCMCLAPASEQRVCSCKAQSEPAPADVLAVGETVTLENIFFELGSSALLPESFAELDKLAELLNNADDYSILIRGHTDNQGTEALNQSLSEARARAVADYLQQQGIASQRLQWEGVGSAEPRSSNSTEEGRQLNRRVEFTVLQP